MKRIGEALLAGMTASVLLTAPAAAHPIFGTCPPDSVKVGVTCIDKYEASVWQIPDPTGTNARLVKKLQKGRATLADLTAAGATQLGTTFPPFSHAAFPVSFPPNGNWTAPVYAASVPGVRPTSSITWFQAEQACRLAGKRLPTNQEWQAAAAGTPDPAGGVDDGATQCNVVTAGGATIAGSRSACVSTWGAFDMVGNVWEWVADWGALSTGCVGWGSFSDDHMCLSGASETETVPGVMSRGGDYADGASAGVFAVNNNNAPPPDDDNDLGFRCAR
jgi:formylglycine-generating enzyme required for sulfatase activity